MQLAQNIAKISAMFEPGRINGC